MFPCALTFNTYVAAAKRTDGKIRLYSLNFEKTGLVEADINHLAHDPKQDWANYPLGVFWAMQRRGLSFDGGADMLFWGDVPLGAGLSSSASIELAAAVGAEHTTLR